MEQDTTTAMPVMDGSKQNDGKGWKIVTVIASVVAVCGIGFGVYGMIQSSQKDNQISDLRVQVEDSDGKITTLETEKIETTTNDETVVTISDSIMGYRNRILVSSDSSMVYTTNFDSSTYLPNNSVLSIALADGVITDCLIGIKTDTGIAYRDPEGEGKCTINGIDKKIYKVVEFGRGQDYSYFNVGFIMEDGTVQYFSLEDALGGSNFSAEKVLKIDGYVINTVDVNATSRVSGHGYRQTVFVLNDGSFVDFDESML